MSCSCTAAPTAHHASGSNYGPSNGGLLGKNIYQLDRLLEHNLIASSATRIPFPLPFVAHPGLGTYHRISHNITSHSPRRILAGIHTSVMDRLYLYTCLFLWPALAFALPQAASTTSSTSPTSTTQAAFPTMSAQDGVGVPVGGVGSTDSGSAAGAAGSDKGAWALSTGAIVGIAVGIFLVVIGIAAMWLLWYLAKKRQWNVRESIRHASRRFTGCKNPPKNSSANKNRRGTVYTKPAKATDTRAPRAKTVKPSARIQDLETGPTGAIKLPTHGWLAGEKERSRSRSREDEERAQKDVNKPAGGAGWKAKLPFGGR